MKTKVCPVHGRLPVSEFHKNRAAKDGLQGVCKKCSHANALKWQHANPEKTAAMARSYRERNPEKAKAAAKKWYQANKAKKVFRTRLRRYGLTEEEYQNLLERSNNGCEICGEPFRATPHIDHCHDTGRVRGLLCSHCNHGLGKFRNDPQLLRKAIRYLKRCVERSSNRSCT